ncbi:hypothetical protein KFK09_006321 [Dendrobium nobile]|uniref:Protein APEM9 n=1 Tax=Dendrobium nobile TaxID=94219 RepID=A0A8T3BU69_DENNO|nr:hypothetical protein KFK09_006321 [Dendrobium nobile]
MAQVIKSGIWDEIDLSERYMVCGLFNEACSLASSQIQNLRTSFEPIPEIELSGMMESAGMVFVQSLRELGRTAELFAELKVLFGSVEAIPIQVFLTGTCMQISEGTTTNLTIIFEEFFKKWRYVDNDHYVFPKEDQSFSKCPWQSALDSEKYLEVAELFAMVLLGRVLGQPELAISWIEKSDLPEDKRQDMLRRLHSIYLAANSSSSISSATVQNAEEIGETSSQAEFHGKSTNSSNHMNGHGSKVASSKVMNPSIKFLTHRSSPFWWFSTVRVKLGGIHLVLPRGRIILVGLVMAFASYFFQRKASELRKFAWRQIFFIQRALIDAWQLAFSVQVNPLAAVQQISAAPRSIG